MLPRFGKNKITTSQVYCGGDDGGGGGDGGTKTPNHSQMDISIAGGGGSNTASTSHTPQLGKQDLVDNQAITSALGVILENGVRYEHENKERLCIICFERQRDIVLYPCRHVCICSACSDIAALKSTCPVCRAVIESSEKLFMS